MRGWGRKEGKRESKSRKASCHALESSPARAVCEAWQCSRAPVGDQEGCVQFPAVAVRASGWRFISRAVLQAAATWLC